MLTIETYNENERFAIRSLSARAIESFGPVTFNATSYPVRVSTEAEILRYVDTMHDTKSARYYKKGVTFSRKEGDVIRDICDTVANFTGAQYGRRTRPWMAPLAAVTVWRIVAALTDVLGIKNPSILEFGPGSGYLGAQLIRFGYRYASMDNTQCFYLWQNRLYTALSGSGFYDMAESAEQKVPADVKVVHIPWWHFVGFGSKPPIQADIVICDHALGELSVMALRSILRSAREILSGAGPKLFLFSSPGATFISNFESILEEFERADYGLISYSQYFAFAPRGSKLYKHSVSKDYILDRGLYGKIAGKIKRRLTSGRNVPLAAGHASLQHRVPMVGGGADTLQAADIIQLDRSEAPLDYEFLAQAGYEVPGAFRAQFGFKQIDRISDMATMKPKALVTGGAGFIGSHMVDRLLADGHEVVVIDNLATGRLDNLAHHRSNPRLSVHAGDINDPRALERSMAGVKWVFHLAALADIVPSIREPLNYFRANVDGTMAVLEASRAHGIERFLYTASSSCYGIPDAFPTPESAEMRPQYPYALTKRLGEELVLHWAQVYDLPAVSLRLFNVYGPRHRTAGTYGAMFGVFLAQKLANKPYTIVGDGTQTRDFTYVTDVVDAFASAAASPLIGEIMNVGSDGTYSVNRIVELLGGPSTHIPKRPGEPDCTWADISRIKRLLNWRPKVGLEVGISLLLEHIELWRDAPVWTPESIATATSDWFKYVGKAGH